MDGKTVFSLFFKLSCAYGVLSAMNNYTDPTHWKFFNTIQGIGILILAFIIFDGGRYLWKKSKNKDNQKTS